MGKKKKFIDQAVRAGKKETLVELETSNPEACQR